MVNNVSSIQKNVLDYILNDVKLSLSRLGINTELSVEETSKGGIKLQSNPFQTMPVLFKNLYIDGNVYVIDSKDDEDSGFNYIRIDMNYRWETFNRGYNGTSLGYITYRVRKDINESITLDDMDYHVRKDESLSI